jgi:hypothetical protein
MKWLAMIAVALVGVVAIATAGAPQSADAGKKAFVEVARVLVSPRCKNCHPNGNTPLQGDIGKPHAMNVSRGTIASGVPCATCHQTRNSDAIGIVGGPPGAPNWGLPPADIPMVFEGKTTTALCEQLKDPAKNHNRTLAMLLDHVTHDKLVLWGWDPGGKRTTPPLSHDAFVAAFTTWVDSGGACP